MGINSPSTIGAVSQAATARITGLSLSTVKALTRSGELRSFRVGRRRLVSHDAIRDFIAKQEAKR